VVYFKVPSQHLPGSTEENHEIPSQSNGLQVDI
jgi:hypothetical protein